MLKFNYLRENTLINDLFNKLKFARMKLMPTTVEILKDTLDKLFETIEKEIKSESEKQKIENLFKKAEILLEKNSKDLSYHFIYDFYKYKFHSLRESFYIIQGDDSSAELDSILKEKFKPKELLLKINIEEELNHSETKVFTEKFFSSPISNQTQKDDLIKASEQISKKEPKNYIEYLQLERELGSYILRHVELKNETILKESKGKETENSSDSREFVIAEMQIELKQLTEQYLEPLKINFIKFCLNHSNPALILFCDENLNLLIGDKKIKKRYYELAPKFHVDKCSRKNNSVTIMFDEMTKKINIIYDSLKTNQENSSVDNYEELANTFFQMAIDCQNYIKGSLHLLKKLSSEQLSSYTQKQIHFLLKDFAIKSYGYYRESCILIDKQKNLTRQIQLRKNMALTLYLADQLLEAQLYAIGALYLLEKVKFGASREKDIQETKQILLKIKNKAQPIQPSQPNTSLQDKKKEKISLKDDAHLEINSESNEKALVAIDAKTLSLIDDQVLITNSKNTQQFRNAIHSDIVAVTKEILLRPPRSLSHHTVSEELIRYTKFQANRMRISSGAVGLNAFGLGLGFAVGGGLEIYGALTAATSLTEAVGLLGGLSGAAAAVGAFAIGVGAIIGACFIFYHGYHYYQEKIKVPKIQEELNKIVTEAIKIFDEGNYEAFLTKMAQPLSSGERIIEYDVGNTLKITPNKIVDLLLKYGVMPHGIAYLMILLGEVLINGKIHLTRFSYTEHKYKAQEILREVCDNTDLINQAKEIDQYVISKGEKKPPLFNILKFYANTWMGISDNLYEALSNNPAIARLIEFKNLAKINLALLLLEADTEINASHIGILLQEVKQTFKENYSFNSLLERRVHIIEDFMNALGIYQEEKEKSSTLYLTENLNEMTIHCRKISQILLENHLSKCIVFPLSNNRQSIFSLISDFAQENDSSFFISFERFNKKFIKSKNNPEYSKLMENLDIKIIEKLNTLEQIESSINMQSYQLWLELLAKLFRIEIQIFELTKYEQYGEVFQRKALYQRKNKPSIYFAALIHTCAHNYYHFDKLKLFNYLPLYWIDLQLKDLVKGKEKSLLYKKRAEIYANRAQENEISRKKIEALQDWHRAKEDYLKALYELNPNHHPMLVICLARCLIMLSKYEQADLLLNKHKDILQEMIEYVMLKGELAFRRGKYGHARLQFNQVLLKSSEHKEGKKYLKILNNLQEESKSFSMKNLYLESNVQYEENFFVKRQTGRKRFILSIDGGGVRGVLPALWLSEIEHKTHRPISSIFNFFAGTSTGAILTAGLSIPSSLNSSIPKHKASDLLDLYTSKAEKIFTKQQIYSFFARAHDLTRPRYTDQGRSAVFKSYFEDMRLSNAINGLLIPVIYENNMTKTHLFNSLEVKSNPSENYELFDVLMAATAAPTYFPAYEIANEIFIDGGVQMNNPALAAYSKVISLGYQKHEINVISLGTGDYVPEPLSPDRYRGTLFYATKLKDVTLVGHSGNVDTQMHAFLGKGYHRWQVWLDTPIALDDFSQSSVNNLVDMGRAYLEEMYASDDNYLNRLIENLIDENDNEFKHFKNN